MKRYISLIMAVALIGFTALGVQNVKQSNHRVELREVQLKDASAQLKTLQLKYNVLNTNLDTELHQNTQDVQKVQDLEKQKQDLESQKKDLESQLQARLEQKQIEQEKQTRLASAVVNKVTGTATASAAPVVSNDSKAFIYSHESSNNPGAINVSSGACGLGQALPCSKMPCSLSDYACQDQFFTGYMQSRYGSWENAEAFWRSHQWW